MEINKRLLDGIQPAPETQIVWDRGRVPGFGVKILPTGRKVFILDTRIEGKTRRLTLGRYGPLTLHMARKLANDRLGEIAEGRDPTQEKHAARAVLTVADLCDLYLEAASAGLVITRFGRPKKASTVAIDRGFVKRHIKPLIGRIRVDKLTRADVQKMIDGIAAGKTATVEKTRPRGRALVTGGNAAATRTAELLGGIWTWAERRGHATGQSPTSGTDRVRSSPRDRRLSADELQALGKALRQAEDDWRVFEERRQRAKRDGKRGPFPPKGLISPFATTVFRLLSLTGLRPSEAAALKWREIDLRGQVLTLEDSKTGRSTRPLGSAAVRLIEKIPLVSNEWLFPSVRGPNNGSFKKASNEILKRAGIRATPKVLRSTFASVAADIGYSGGTIAEMLGHSRQGVTERHYIRRVDAVLIAAADEVSEHIDAILSDR